MFAGESQGKALNRVFPELNSQGYKVAFIVEDRPSLLWQLMNIFIALGTLGLYWRKPGLLIVGEKVEERDSQS